MRSRWALRVDYPKITQYYPEVRLVHHRALWFGSWLVEITIAGKSVFPARQVGDVNPTGIDLLATIVIDASACDATAFDVDMQFFLVDRPKAHIHIGEHLAAWNAQNAREPVGEDRLRADQLEPPFD